eukprot:CAMPEP_0118992696 /NCGR_PEP_ID=MMETSP1173-20130426/53837_1 /TAXON_ID=1034831 /ORGANISM="Rhizochromulina marina cf, Strain CCMP1243" /LENGTH=33 /DNA_ID= /DNA_START= /DNA_END= /DNA_ORIENTATION=
MSIPPTTQHVTSPMEDPSASKDSLIWNASSRVG